jgi:hypothetical protein
MGIQTWFSKLRKREDAAAIRRAEDVMDSTEPLQDEELRSGDVEGMAADRRAAGSMLDGSMGDLDRLSE